MTYSNENSFQLSDVTNTASDLSSLQLLQEDIGYNFKNTSLLNLALLHKSMANYRSKGPLGLANNERLEFLGDAVLDLVMSDMLLHLFPEDTEGDLTKKRASLVNEVILNEIALELRLDEWIQLGKAEMENGLNKNSRLLSSCLEALLGAIYLDGGYAVSQLMISRLFKARIEEIQKGRPLFDDYKTKLQEVLQKKYHSTPEYFLLSTDGPDHQKIFKVEVQIQGRSVAIAVGRSKKIAEQNAAKKALEVSYEL